MAATLPIIPGNLAYDYVSDIPWESTPVFAFGGDTNKYLEALRHAVDRVPTGDMKISFWDNIWDFNPYFDGIMMIRIEFSLLIFLIPFVIT